MVWAIFVFKSINQSPVRLFLKVIRQTDAFLHARCSLLRRNILKENEKWGQLQLKWVIIHLDGCILSLSARERPQSEGPSFERDFANCALKQMQHKEKSICIIAKRGRNPYKPLCSLELKQRRHLQRFAMVLLWNITVRAQVLICHRPSAVWGCSAFYSATNNLFCPARRTRWEMFLPLGIYLLGCNGCKGSGNNNTGGGQSRQAKQKRHHSQLESVVLAGLCGHAVSHSGD